MLLDEKLDYGRLREALSRKAEYGVDLDLSNYSIDKVEPCPKIDSVIAKKALEVGVDVGMEDRAGTYFQIDYSVLYKALQKQFKGDIEVTSIEEAEERYEWVRRLSWRLVSPYTDKYTAFTALNQRGGYFIHILEGRKLQIPIQSCLFVYSNSIIQPVHNLIVAEPGSEAHIITGCTLHPKVERGLHIGVTEFYVRRGAKLTFTMVHSWGPSFDVRPRTGILVEDEASFVNNYVMVGALRSFQSYPRARLVGEDSRVVMNTVIYASGGSDIDVGGGARLEGRGSKAEISSKIVAADKARVKTRGLIEGVGEQSRGHIECRGLMLSGGAEVSAIPVLRSRTMSSELTHEAAIGRIAEEQVSYLMARGIPREEAESLIVRGFLDVGYMGLPPMVEASVRRVVELAAKGF